jgi:hypothetical protein
VCIRYRGNVSTEPLTSNDRGIFTELFPSNDKGIFTEPLPRNDKGGFLPSRCLAAIRGLLPSQLEGGHLTDPGNSASNDRGIHGHTHRQQRDLINLLSFFQNKKRRLKRT